MLFLALVASYCNGNIKIKVNGQVKTMAWGDGFYIDSSLIHPAPKPLPKPGDTTAIGIVLDCSRCPDETVSKVLDGVVWTGYKVAVKLSDGVTANKYLMPDKTPIPKGCVITGLVKLSK